MPGNSKIMHCGIVFCLCLFHAMLTCLSSIFPSRFRQTVCSTRLRRWSIPRKIHLPTRSEITSSQTKRCRISSASWRLWNHDVFLPWNVASSDKAGRMYLDTPVVINVKGLSLISQWISRPLWQYYGNKYLVLQLLWILIGCAPLLN